MLHLFKKNRNRGFTLIETIIVVSLTVLIGGAISSIIVFFYRTNDYVIQENSAVQNARQGLATSIQNLREASYGDDGAYPILSAATSTITFYADVSGDGDVEQIRYYLSGLTLYRGVTKATGFPPTYVGQPEVISTVATNLRNGPTIPIFQYYDNNGLLLTSPINVSSISSITTTLKIDVDPSRSPAPYTLVGSATLRNL